MELLLHDGKIILHIISPRISRIWDISFKPDGSEFVIASGNCIFIHKTDDLQLRQTLKSHKDTVYSVAYSHDGQYISSGSADKCVIIWKSDTLEGLLQYTFITGLWTLEQKAVVKTKLPCRPSSCSWKSDGKYFAIGLVNGTITIRGKSGEELLKVDRPGSPIIWCLKWSYSKSEQHELLAVLDWNQKLSFYQLCGKQVISGNGKTVYQLLLSPKVGKDRCLGFDPCDLAWIGEKSEAVAVCGSNCRCLLYSAEGNCLTTISVQPSWVWCCRKHPKLNQIILGCEDGTLTCIELVAPPVHSLYHDRYAYRESLTDVVVQHLVTQQKARIKCRDYVKNISVYRNRLAGIKQREWSFDSDVLYLRTIGGPQCQESLLVGLQNGQAIKVILDNTFYVELPKVNSGIRCMDINCTRDKLGVIDSNGLLSVFDLSTNELLFQEPNILSLAWNATNPELLCFSGNEELFIKAGQFPKYPQHNLARDHYALGIKLHKEVQCQSLSPEGVAVGFTGSHVFCLNDQLITRVDVCLSPAMYQYLHVEKFEEALLIGCYGLTDPDWLVLAHAALKKLNLDVAKYAYVQFKDTLMLTFIQQLEDRRQRGDWTSEEPLQSPLSQLVLGDVAAHLGEFSEAAALYSRAGGANRVVDMYTDLRLFDEARQAMAACSNAEERRQLIAKHADWAKSTREHRTAAKMYMDAGEFGKAIELAAENHWTDILLDISRRLDKADLESLGSCARHLTKLGEFAFAADCYAKYGDVENRLAVYIEARTWQEAFSLVEQYPEYTERAYAPYAEWLAESDKFEEAQAAFARAGKQAQAVRVLEQLATCAANESRLEDAGFYHWKLSTLCLDMASQSKDPIVQAKMIEKFVEFETKADIYYVYANIYRYLHEPLHSQMPESYFNMARYLVQVLQNESVNGVSISTILFILAKYARSLSAFKLARQVYDRLLRLKLPSKMREAIEVDSLTVRTKPVGDSEDVCIICYRCSTTNPLVSHVGNQCTNCGEPFIYSFISLEQLPLVEFVAEDGMSHADIIRCLNEGTGLQAGRTKQTGDKRRSYRGKNSGFSKNVSSGENSNAFGDSSENPDPFTAHILNTDLSSGDYAPVKVDEKTLKAMSPTEVIVLDYTPPLRPKYYKSVIPEISITQCQSCHKLFTTDDYELAVLQRGHCPFCRTPHR